METRNNSLKKLIMIGIVCVLVLVLAIQAYQSRKVDETSSEGDIGIKSDLVNSADEVVDQGEFTIIHISTDSDTFVEASNLSSDEKEKVNAAIMDYMVRSAAWDAIPVEDMGEHYIIIQRGTDSLEEKYYLFKLDDKYALQWEKAKRWSYISDMSYNNIEEVFKSHEE